MLGELTTDQCLQVLRSVEIGRIGCYGDGKVYIVPVTFVCDDNFIYAHSKEGLKTKMMRKHPKVCFQVDRIDNMANWRSVLVWGMFEEIKNKNEQSIAMKILRDRLSPMVLSESVKAPRDFGNAREISKPFKAVAFRISIDEITGRFEKST